MKRSLTIIFSLAVLSLANFGHATTLYWDGGASNIGTTGDGLSQGGAGTWDTTIQNWDQGSGLPHIAWDNSQNYNAYFASPVGLVTLNAAITANSLTIGATNGYVITDGGNSVYTLTLNAATNNANVTVGANVVNSTTFSTYGNGTLTLTNTSPGLTGTLAINAGTLTLGNNATGSTTANNFGDVTVAANATFNPNPGSTATYNQNIGGLGSVSVHANSSSSSVYLAGQNTFSGNVYINQATLQVASISDTASSGLGLGTNVTIGAGASASGLTYSGGGDTTSRTLTLAGTTVNTSLSSSGSGPLVWLGPLAFGSASRTLNLGGTYQGLNIFGGNITNGTSTVTIVAKSGVGMWMLTGTNTYSGGTTFGSSSGSLVIPNDQALGASTGAVIFAGSGTLKSISNNVTLGASRTVTVSNTFTAGFGVFDTNNLTVASYITGPGSVSKASSGYALGWTRFGNDTNNYAGDFSVGFGNTEFTSVADQGTPSSLGQGATATGGRITLGNSTSIGTLRYVGTSNSATHRPLYWTATSAGYTLDNTNTGTIAYLSTAQLVNGAGAKTLTLTGSNTGTNTLAHVINDNGGAISLAKSGAGKWVLTGANTYSGATTISGGNLSVSSDANLGTAPASPTPGSLTISSGALSTSAGFTLNANRGIALGPTTGSGGGTLDVAGGTTLIYGGIITNNGSGEGALSKTSGGTLTLSGVEAYTGNTTINSGTLALSGSGSIATSTNIIVAAGATLDVSGVSGDYTLAAGQTLYATNGATVTLAGSLSLGLASLEMTNVVNTPTITVTGGTLTLASGNAVTVNVRNGGGPLGGGNYKLIAKGSGGSVGGAPPAAVTVGGDGLATGATASLSISSGELYLAVSGGTLYPPVVDSFGLVGSGVVLTFSGTNGQGWKILTSTNVTKPLTNWDVVTNGTFGGAPVRYTNATPVDYAAVLSCRFALNRGGTFGA